MTHENAGTTPESAEDEPTVPGNVCPSPAAVAILALLTGALGVALKWDQYSWPGDDQGPGRVLQALWFFPTAAWLSIWLLQKTPWSKPSSLKGWLVWSLPTYLLISVLSTVFFSAFAWAFLSLGNAAENSHLEALAMVLSSQVLTHLSPSTLLGFWFVMATDSPVAFIAFASGMLALPAAGAKWRLPALAGPSWRRGGAALVSLSLMACAGWWTASFMSERQETLVKHENWQLQRIGMLTGTTDQERAAARTAAHQARGETELRRWLRQQPTRSTYTVGDGSNQDFRTLSQALAHLESVMDSHAPASFVSEVDGATGPFFTIKVSAGTYEGPLKLAGPVRIQSEGAAGSVVLSSGNLLQPVISMERLNRFQHAPALIGVTVWGGAQVPPVQVNGEDTGGVLIQGNIINGKGPFCSVEGGGQIRGNQFRGECGVALTGIGNLSDNSFAAVTGTAITVTGSAKVGIRGNRYATNPKSALIWVAQEAQAEIEERALLIAGGEWVVLQLEGNARVTLRSSQLSNPGSACIWLAKGTPVLEVHGTRFESCGNAGFPAVLADSGGEVTIRSTTFTPVAQRTTLHTLVSADKGAKLTIETSSVE